MNETAELKIKERVNSEELFESSPFTVDSLDGRGGSFLVVRVDKGNVFSREKFTDQHKMFESAAREFAIKRILPVSRDLNILNKDLTLEVFKEMGELGFLGVDVPEDCGGLGLDKTTACIVADVLSEGRSASIMVTMSAHTGIATLPIIWYGNKFQKEKYLTKMASGEHMACYALTEPNAGSDALSGTTTAILSEDSKYYVLNGQKIYITNGSWSDICVTFAAVNGKYTAFILDKSCEGWVIGNEENKMGIKGSSTVTIYFENCKVPVENVLGEVGQGGAIAFNCLYAGRYKLGVTTAAGAKYTLNGALDFAFEREQFSRSISNFGMIQNKLVKMLVKSWEADTVNYMTAGSIDKQLENLDKKDPDYFDNVQKAVEDHGIEASVCKVVGSEALAFNVDEGVQIFGGAGFIEDYEMAGMYRDERINRIFEGTNEINRMIVGGYTLKKAILEDIPIRDLILDRENNWIPDLNLPKDEHLCKESQVIEFIRSAMVYTLDQLILTYGQDFKNEQWLLEPFSDIVISLCILDTGFKRYNQLEASSHKDEVREVLQYSVVDQFQSVVKNTTDILSHLDSFNSSQSNIEKLNKWINKLNFNHDKISLKQNIIKTLFKHKKYYLD